MKGIHGRIRSPEPVRRLVIGRIAAAGMRMKLTMQKIPVPLPPVEGRGMPATFLIAEGEYLTQYGSQKTKDVLS